MQAYQVGLRSPKGVVQLETETLTNRSKPKSLPNAKIGPAWALGPDDRSNIETEIPSRVEIESMEPRPTLLANLHKISLSGSVTLTGGAAAYHVCFHAL